MSLKLVAPPCLSLELLALGLLLLQSLLRRCEKGGLLFELIRVIHGAARRSAVSNALSQ